VKLGDAAIGLLAVYSCCCNSYSNCK